MARQFGSISEVWVKNQGMCESRFCILLSDTSFAARKAASGLTVPLIFFFRARHTQRSVLRACLSVFALPSALRSWLPVYAIKCCFTLKGSCFLFVKLHLICNCRAKYIEGKPPKWGQQKVLPNSRLLQSAGLPWWPVVSRRRKSEHQRRHRASGVVVVQEAGAGLLGGHPTQPSRVRYG